MQKNKSYKIVAGKVIMTISLEYLMYSEKQLVFDTSAISHHLHDESKDSLVQQIENSAMNVEFMRRLALGIEQNGCDFYVTGLILGELRGREYNPLNLGESEGAYSERRNLLIQLDKQRQVEVLVQKGIADVFERKERVVKLEGEKKEDFEALKARYDWMKKGFGLSEADFEILMSVNAIGYRGKEEVTLVTNDLRNIAKAGGVLMKSEKHLQDYVFYLQRNGYFSFDILNGFHT